jgi:NADH-quinone oxidoreductase subunit G
LNAADASLLGVKAGEPIKVIIRGAMYELDVLIRNDLPRGVAIVPVGFPSTQGIQLPAEGKLTVMGAELHGAVR